MGQIASSQSAWISDWQQSRFAGECERSITVPNKVIYFLFPSARNDNFLSALFNDHRWDNSPEREQFPYAIDGVVIKVNGLREQMLLGTTTRAPKWAIAFKFGAAKAITTLRDITYQVTILFKDMECQMFFLQVKCWMIQGHVFCPQVGRTGKVTPVAELSPVQLLGTVVSRATLHNIEYLNKMGIRIGGKFKALLLA